jgi:D-alanine-D-alanine ligase
VKPRLQDASIGIEQDSVFENQENLREKLKELYEQFGPLLIEEYVGGREFNVSIIGFPEPEVLPIAEIVFEGFPTEMFRIVGYRAKWDISSFEYQHTVRRFPRLPGELEGGLKAVALECFRLFMLRDYARVDIRLDEQGQIHVLEMNANPCLSPDAGFAVAAEQAGMNYTQMVQKLLLGVEQRSCR